MLSSEQSIVEFKGAAAFPDRLERLAHGHYVGYAARMLQVYAGGVGRTRRDLHRAIGAILEAEPDCPTRRVQAFCKLLDNAADYQTDLRGEAAKLRLRVFRLAAKMHPLMREAKSFFGSLEKEAKESIAREIGRPWAEIEAALYTDAIGFQPLERFQPYAEPQLLLRHYNVAQAQACLYRAERMWVTLKADFKRFFRHVKFTRLMFEIRRMSPTEYRIELTGPASVLQETRRYGVQFAKLLPGLLACRDWKLRATIPTPWRTQGYLELSSADGLQSHLPPEEPFDSELEAKFAAKWGAEREGWKLIREGAVLNDRQATFVPDFVFRHTDGREVLFEIVGFWTAEYLEKKRATLQQFQTAGRNIVLAVPAAALIPSRPIPAHVISYKTAIKVDAVLAALGTNSTSAPKTSLDD